MKYTIAFTESRVRLFLKILRESIFIVKYKGYHRLSDEIVITSINSVSNLVATRTNPLRKHQIRNICFS